MFNIAIENDWLHKNPVSRKMRFPEKNYVVRYLKDDEEERIFKACPDYFRPLLITALNTGLRKSNIRLLKWENVKRSEINKYNNIISFKSYFTHYIIFYFSSFLFNF